MSVSISPPMFLQFFNPNNSGAPASGYQLFTYVAGTSTKQATWTDSTQTVQNANPLPLDSNGRAVVWPDPTLSYKFVVAPPNDTDPPASPIWTTDDIESPITGASFDEFFNEAFIPYKYLPLDPRYYGAIGDGVTDDTAAMNSWVTAINTTSHPTAVWPSGCIFLCGPLSTITASNFTLVAAGATIRAKANSWTSATTHLSFTGNTIRISDLICDGNQAAFGSSPGGLYMISFSGTDVRCARVSVINSCASGCGVLGSEMRFTDCRFASNAGLGVEFIISSYCHFEQCEFNYNGYGFHNSWSTNAFIAFGFAMRFRSHHITFVACEAIQNGRDGMNVNQGSYAVKFSSCLAWMNDDGGFTIAADNTGTGHPGEGESPYDLEYLDCESYNNWSSGLAAYSPVFNVTVMGGRYYNNHRLSGQQADATSYNSGVYFAAGSESIYVRTKAYDDRQLCPITAVAGGGATITATGWVAGTMAYYPCVALYNSSLSFQGYGTITAESSGSVTISTTPNNGVTLASISSGWFVSQRVQHNGVMTDNNCQGTLIVDGFGFLPGINALYGWKTISGPDANGQNIVVPEYKLDPNNEILLNPTFDSGVTNWTFSQGGSGGSLNAYSTAGVLLRSAGAAQLIGGSGGSWADASNVTNSIYATADSFVDASVWAYSIVPAGAYISLFWNPGSPFSTTVTHPGGGWKKLTIGVFLPVGNTQIDLRIGAASGNTVYFDTASIRVRFDQTDSRDYFYPSRNLPF